MFKVAFVENAFIKQLIVFLIVCHLWQDLFLYTEQTHKNRGLYKWIHFCSKIVISSDKYSNSIDQ